MKTLTILVIFLTSDICCFAQQDSAARRKQMDSVVVYAYLYQNAVRPLPAIHSLMLTSGKKTEVIDMNGVVSGLPNKTARQVFARVPGVFVYDMDGSGNQMNIATRGLDPHRGWEFNIRKDGIITNSDMYGYPASHFSMPLESIGRIELIRGAGSLQYGAQFGGMLNYQTKQPDTSRVISAESITTAGSYGLLSSYLAAGGQWKKWKYYAYVYRKSRGGYRDGEESKSEAQSIRVSYQANRKLIIQLDWTRSMYRHKMAGQLTDTQFEEDPRQATRSRNYFSPDIQVPSVQLNLTLGEHTQLQWQSSAVLGRRSSVMFDKPANVRDTINVITHTYNNRQVDIDRFHSFSHEARLLHQYRWWGRAHYLSAGVQYMHNRLHRTQLGNGTTGSDYDLTLVTPGFGRDMEFTTRNLALFAENKWQLSPHLSINTGLRIEQGQTDLTGKLVYYPDDRFPVSIHHQFPLLGAQFSYTGLPKGELYGGWSQAYRPVLFKDIVPGSLYEQVDPSIRDAFGNNIELGWRGSWRFLRWDVTAFLLDYHRRFGIVTQTDDQGNLILYRTNIGRSISKGLEILLQADWVTGSNSGISLFTSTSLTDARYRNARIRSGNETKDIDGNRVESVPACITRNGVNFRTGILTLGLLYSYTSKTFADALNTEEAPPATGAVGRVPAYGILDLNASIRLANGLELRGTLNNVLDKDYFTKRPSFYPGPGIWPSDGRNWTIGLRMAF